MRIEASHVVDLSLDRCRQVINGAIPQFCHLTVQILIYISYEVSSINEGKSISSPSMQASRKPQQLKPSKSHQSLA